jgi:hypothetical protein
MRSSGVLPSEAEVVSLSRHSSGRSGALSDRVAGIAITGSAFLAILSLILIFIFIGKEALPIFTSAEIRQEANLSKLFLPQPAREGAQAEYNWQPVSEVPKYSLMPLLAGTLKVTIMDEGNSQTRNRASCRDSQCGGRIFLPDGAGRLAAECVRLDISP